MMPLASLNPGPCRLFAAAAIAAALAGCGSAPVDRFYTLGGGPAAVTPPAR